MRRRDITCGRTERALGCDGASERRSPVLELALDTPSYRVRSFEPSLNELQIGLYSEPKDRASISPRLATALLASAP